LIVTKPLDFTANLNAQLLLGSGKRLLVGGLKLALELAEVGLIDEYEVDPAIRASLTLQVALALLGRLTYHVHILEMSLKTRPDHRAWPR